MANVTLAIDDGSLRRARIRAVMEGTSVNRVVRDFVERYADGGADQEQAAENLIALAAQSGASSGAGGRTWTREQLYER
ncbi:MAG: hypothetical protein LBJ02_04635 [Bifidobacteriaceae bacterium]|nr:hypothetical protein [Bifidobacteriaceae bacterium]